MHASPGARETSRALQHRNLLNGKVLRPIYLFIVRGSWNKGQLHKGRRGGENVKRHWLNWKHNLLLNNKKCFLGGEKIKFIWTFLICKSTSVNASAAAEVVGRTNTLDQHLPIAKRCALIWSCLPQGGGFRQSSYLNIDCKVQQSPTFIFSALPTFNRYSAQPQTQIWDQTHASHAGPSPGFSSGGQQPEGGAKNQKGGHIFKIQN